MTAGLPSVALSRESSQEARSGLSSPVAEVLFMCWESDIVYDVACLCMTGQCAYAGQHASSGEQQQLHSHQWSLLIKQTLSEGNHLLRSCIHNAGVLYIVQRPPQCPTWFTDYCTNTACSLLFWDFGPCPSENFTYIAGMTIPRQVRR